MNYENIADQLFFSKEAADYLGISVQRLNQLIHDGKIIPMKKNASGTLFHIDELNKRKEELSIFNSQNSKGGGKGMFEINSQTKQEAVNFATFMTLLNCTESKAEPEFESLANKVDITLPLDDLNVCAIYSKHLSINTKNILDVYKITFSAFTQLQPQKQSKRHDFYIFAEGSRFCLNREQSHWLDREKHQRMLRKVQEKLQSYLGRMVLLLFQD